VYSQSIVRVIKSRRMKWVGHVARMGKREAYTGFWWGNLEGKRPLGRPRSRWEDKCKAVLAIIHLILRLHSVRCFCSCRLV